MSVRLFVLGALRDGDAHGYQLIEKGRLWGLESWTEISYSSIYHALRTLAAEGLAAELGKEREDGKPERTVYRITKKGREAFASLMEEAALSVGAAKDPLYLVLAFFEKLPPSRRASLLEARKGLLEGQRDAVRAKLAFFDGGDSAEYWTRAAVELDLARVNAELEWLAEIDAAKS